MNIFRILPARWILNLATLGPIGYTGKMPGTLGSFIGLLWYTLFFHEIDAWTYLFWGALSVYLACGICTQAEILLQQKDPSFVILDEMVAMPFCFLGLQGPMQHYPVWIFMLLGFILFRCFDIIKPLGIKKIQNLPGGRGVVFDDIAAALATCACLHLLTFIFLS